LKKFELNVIKSSLHVSNYSNLALTVSQQYSLVEAVNRNFEDFTTFLSNTYPRLNKDDIYYCCLCLLDLSESQMAVLMQKALSTVFKRLAKLKDIFGTTENLSIALKKML
jgi:hypothetical protein